MKRIEVIGLGAGDIEQLSLGIYHKLIKAEMPLFIRTSDHPVIEMLEKEGVDYQSFDSVYLEHDGFETVYQEIVARLVNAAAEHGTIVYAVPGHPMLAERTVQLLLEEQNVDIQIIGGQSYLDDLFTALKIDPIDGFQFLDATSFKRSQIDYTNHLVFCQVYDKMIASELKLTLLEDLRPEQPIHIVEAVGSSSERIEVIPLVELDHQMTLSNLTSVYVPPVDKDDLAHQFSQLREVISILRGPDGCPWDKKQTHESLRRYLVEEAYELIDAIDEQDDDQIIEELGDVLLQVMLHSQIGEDNGYFSIDDVIRTLVEKMIRRHPHVFGDVEANDSDTVVANWQAIKEKEKEHSQPSSRLDRIPQSSSSIIVADSLQKEAAKVGFDWDDPNDIYQKINEELEELKEAVTKREDKEVEKELGDLIFSVINLARHYKVNSDLALRQTNRKFSNRFKYIEQKLIEQGQEMADMSLTELDRIWDEAKEEEN